MRIPDRRDFVNGILMFPPSLATTQRPRARPYCSFFHWTRGHQFSDFVLSFFALVSVGFPFFSLFDLRNSVAPRLSISSPVGVAAPSVIVVIGNFVQEENPPEDFWSAPLDALFFYITSVWKSFLTDFSFFFVGRLFISISPDERFRLPWVITEFFFFKFFSHPATNNGYLRVLILFY